ncbi:MAG TPA: VOC family protein [Thermoleophilaceae bacterium]|nr:VOC family protein [Thermoleophilaceae bacterium]
MPERDRYIPGVPCWVDSTQPDPPAAAEFYGGLFGWEFEDRMPADAPGEYLVARLRGHDVAAVGSQPAGVPPAATWNTYVWVESADDTAAQARDAGGSVLMEPFNVLDAGRMAVLADREGAAFYVWEANGHRGAQIVNEPGSWNWSDLTTRDPGAARAFYGAVFGWEIDAFDPDGGAMVRLPGYGDFLEQRDPGLRDRLAEYQAPEGFGDAVAWLTPATDAGPGADSPPHWGVTFTVEDADATAERAGELGGDVIVPPFDAPWVRLAVLSDPQGGVFSVGKFVPPT